MLAVAGTYQNGILKLEKEYKSNLPVKVIVTFLEDINLESKKTISLSDFSFKKSQQNLIDVKGSFSESIIQERRIDK
jgi:hypothetical protein